MEESWCKIERKRRRVFVVATRARMVDVRERGERR